MTAVGGAALLGAGFARRESGFVTMLRDARWCCSIAGCGGRICIDWNPRSQKRDLGHSPVGRRLGFVLSHPFRTERGMDGSPSSVVGIENANEGWATRPESLVHFSSVEQDFNRTSGRLRRRCNG